jgi:subtilase family serine protease
METNTRRNILISASFFFLLFASAIALVSATPASTASLGASLQFVPLIQLAPYIPAQPGSSATACTTPAPVLTFAFFHCYTPSDIYAAYGVGTLHSEGLTGAGETIVIVDSYGSPTALNDLKVFSQTFGLPQPDLTIINPTGTPTFNPAQHGIQAGWAGETSLDLQWAHAIAPDAKLVLIEANPAETEGVQGFPSIFIGEQYAIRHYPGSVMSQSFAVTEQSFRAAGSTQVSLFDQIYQLAAKNHITVFGSAGDSGTVGVIGGEGVSPARVLPFPTVEWPASDKWVTAAGGTWLQYGWSWDPTVSASTFYSCLASEAPFDSCASSYLSFTSGTRTEAVWKEDWLPASTGGGRSVLYSTPNFQSGISQSVLQGARGLPDLSWNAAVDGGVLVYMSFPGAGCPNGMTACWQVVGGTSASSPQLAGLIALANQLADEEGKQHVGYLNPALYSLPARDFNDIVPQTFGTGAGVTTLQNNSLFGFPTIAGVSTTTGWDLTTGFGTPSADNFVHDLVAALPPST